MAIVGVEGGVPWAWVSGLAITYNGLSVPAHDLHGWSVASLGGNTFYGGYTVLYPDASQPSGYSAWRGAWMEAHPTKHDHTEPQYFNWLNETLFKLKEGRQDIYDAATVLLIEMNQTNTPCSLASCRPAVLEAISSGEVGDHEFDLIVGRLAAYQIYESQAPHIFPTSMEMGALRKGGGSSNTNIEDARCLHRATEAP